MTITLVLTNKSAKGFASNYIRRMHQDSGAENIVFTNADKYHIDAAPIKADTLVITNVTKDTFTKNDYKKFAEMDCYQHLFLVVFTKSIPATKTINNTITCFVDVTKDCISVGYLRNGICYSTFSSVGIYTDNDLHWSKKYAAKEWLNVHKNPFTEEIRKALDW